ncbi:hypothetical protein SAMN06265374_2111 [Roseibium denhamense]|uniref:Uncharacterized protein n=1 Tax=Roseibium denhamense TaxID=76305 RepID=A0ABY1NZ15_9HYPH|nr:hypothetical protein SAMN06265374_2111 [Roseibium denhamense]
MGQNRLAHFSMNFQCIHPLGGEELRPIGVVAPLARYTASCCTTRLAE